MASNSSVIQTNHQVAGAMASEPSAEVDDTIPSWLNAQYIEKIMRNYHKDASIRVSPIQVSYAVGKGDNFASVLYRVRAPYTCQRLKGGKQVGCFIIKAMFDANTFAAERLGEYDVHNKEMDIYETTLPAMVRLQRAIGDTERLFPQVICIDRELDIIVFEDVSVEGFIMLNRLDGLDLVHTKMVLTKMAKMHALAAVYQQRENKLGKYDIGMFNRKTQAFYSFFYTSMDALINMVSSWPGYEHYAEKLKAIRPTFIEDTIKCYSCDEPDDMGTLVHGDLWMNNVMFKYDENQCPIDAIILDFQFSCYGSPTIDLMHFFYTSAKPEIKQTQQDELFQFYYYELVKTLRQLEYPGQIPTLHQFQIKVLKKSFFIFSITMILFPTVIVEEVEDADFEALMGVNERGLNFKKVIFENPKLKPILQHFLAVFDRKGLFDGV